MARRVEPNFDKRLIGVWSRDCLNAPRTLTDTRILFKKDFTGRYETWHHGLSEVITFNWSPPAADRVTMAGIEYMFREPPDVRREPCDWHFEAVPYSIAVELMADGQEAHVLKLRITPQRIDAYALMSADMSPFEHPQF